MIDIKILRQHVELGATPAQIVDLVEKMLAEYRARDQRVRKLLEERSKSHD